MKDYNNELGKKYVAWYKLRKEADKLRLERGSVDNCIYSGSGYPEGEQICFIDYREGNIELDEMCGACQSYEKLTPAYHKKAFESRGLKLSITHLVKKIIKLENESLQNIKRPKTN